jgi:dTDP-4-dehydrorhamnose reductase
MNALIVGARGQLGRELLATAPQAVNAHGVDRGEVDICDAQAVRELIAKSAPQLVINAAGYTAVDRAESEPDQAYRVNGIAPGHLAQALNERGGRLIHVSTDYVFDGTKAMPYRREDMPRPLSVYGKSKLEGERRVAAALGARAVVIRTAWLYSTHGANFVKTMLRVMAERDEVRVVSDQIGTPTWARGLAQCIWQVAARPELTGVFHWTDAGVASWYDFAVAIQEEALALGILKRSARVVPIATSEYPAAARRPMYSVLDKAESWRDLRATAEHWRVALREMLREVLSAE